MRIIFCASVQRHSRYAMNSLQQHFVGLIDNEESSTGDSDSDSISNEYGETVRTVRRADGTVGRRRDSSGSMVPWEITAKDELPGGIFKMHVARTIDPEPQALATQWTAPSMGMHMYVQCDVGSRPYSLTRVPSTWWSKALIARVSRHAVLLSDVACVIACLGVGNG
jgi:hypothetical protein